MIGIFDSGIGGLTVVKEVFQQLPDYPVVYFGDTARTPYGSKSDHTIQQYALEDAQFLIRRGAKIIVIACNTASAVATDYLRQKLSVPVFEVITPAITEAAATTDSKRVGVIGTRATINSRIYRDLLKKMGKDFEIYSEAAPLLVPLIEENWLKREETMVILKHYLQPMRKGEVDTLILACTHYPLLHEAVQRIMGNRVTIVDPARETATQLKKWLGENPAVAKEAREKDGEHFFVSDMTPQFQSIAERFLGRKIKLEETSVEK